MFLLIFCCVLFFKNCLILYVFFVNVLLFFHLSYYVSDIFFSFLFVIVLYCFTF